MALNYNGTSPTAITYNGTDLTVLKYGTTAVWGKPYSLSISAGSNTSVTVNRTSSPNQGASTGTLSSGSVIYYGDVLTISYSVSSGYKISTHTVNGTTFTSGQSFTVTSAISVVTTAVASQSWQSVWTGSQNCSSSGSYFTLPSSLYSYLSAYSADRVRITFTPTITDNLGLGYYSYSTSSTLNGSKNISGSESTMDTTCSIPIQFTGITNTSSGVRWNYTGNSGTQWWPLIGNVTASVSSIRITKIEQYY